MNLPRCPGCTSDYCPIPSDGPKDARIYAFGERPGQTEHFKMLNAIRRNFIDPHEHYCFIGMAGDEFNQNYLSLAGLSRDQIRVGNTVMCGSPNNKAPSKDDIARCSQFNMARELADGQPEIVILMGSTACSLVPDIDLESDHGIPFYGQLFDWSGWIVPMYHPALGLHSTSMMRPMMDDWKRLGAWLETEVWQWAIDQYPYRDYRHGKTVDDVVLYFLTYRGFACQWAGVDTESHGPRPFSIQASICPSTAIMVLEEDQAAIEALGKCLTPYELVYHYAPADHPRMQQLGVGQRYRDSHIEAYNLQLAQGLKALSTRLLGRRRKSWEEIVGRVSKDKLCEWMTMAMFKAHDDWTTLEPRVSEKTGNWLKPKEVRSDAEKTLGHVLRYTQGNTDYDSWGKLREFGADKWLGRMEALVGLMPIKGIGNCQLDEAIAYGCADADDCLTLALMFEQIRHKLVTDLAVTDADKDVLCLPDD